MPVMIRTVVALACLVSSSFAWASDEKQPSYPHFGYEVARAHEIKPHRHTIPLEGIDQGFNQLGLTLIVSATGNVVEAKAGAEPKLMEYRQTCCPETKNESPR